MGNVSLARAFAVSNMLAGSSAMLVPVLGFVASVDRHMCITTFICGRRYILTGSPSQSPGLIRETSLLSLAKVPLPPQSPYDPLHQRSGAALHYILVGVGAEFAEGRATAKRPGSVWYEPRGLEQQSEEHSAGG